MDWMKIGTALFLILLLVYLFPRAKDMLKNSPKASGNDLLSIAIPLLLVILFVYLLIKMV